MKRKQIAAFIIIGCFALTQLTLALYLPALPILTKYFHSTTKTLMLSLSITTFGYAAGQLIWGSLSDYIGRKPVYLTSLSLYALVCILVIYTTHSIHTFYLTMAILGFCAATFTCVGNAYIVDLLGHNNAKVGLTYISISLSLTSVVTPVIASHLITWFNWQAVYFFLLAYGLLMLISIMFFVPESHTNRSNDSKNLLKVYKKLFSHSRYLGYLLTLGLAFGCFLTYVAAAPLIYKNIFHATVNQYGWLFLASSASYLFGSVIVRYRIEHWGHDNLLKIGLFCSLIGAFTFLAMNFFNLLNLYSATLPAAIFLLGLALIIASTKIGAMTIFANNKGTAASIMKFMQIAITTVLTAIAAWVHVSKDINLLSVFFIITITIGIIATKIILESTVDRDSLAKI